MVHRLSRIKGFHVQGTDGTLGHVDDLLVDEAGARVCYLMVDTSNWMGGKWVALSTTAIQGIDWVEGTVQVGLTRDEIRKSPGVEEANVPSHELTPGFVII
jgi:hypothetical protein